MFLGLTNGTLHSHIWSLMDIPHLSFRMASRLSSFGSLFLVSCLAISAQAQDTLKHSLTPPAGTQSDAQLGRSVAVDGNYTIVGAPFDDIVGGDSGVVKVFDSVTGALLHVL